VPRTSMPSTVKRSAAKAQRTFTKVEANAEKEYGRGERARRTAFAVLKRGFEKEGDRWVPKARKGPSDPRSTKSTAEKRAGTGETYGGVDAMGHTRAELYERAKRAGIPGRSSMSKGELAKALARHRG
jgi:hypothetical protein